MEILGIFSISLDNRALGWIVPNATRALLLAPQVDYLI